MTCTAPINIVKNIKETCDNKCNYSFLYPMTNLHATNKGDYIEFTPTDKEKVPPVIYNANKYNVGDFRLYIPSLHTYGDKHASGELVITHHTDSGGYDLIVCIPIKIGSSISGKSQMLDVLVEKVGKEAPTDGAKTIISIGTFTLNNFVSYKPFYSYTGTNAYDDNCSVDKINYVVFDNTGAITLSKKGYDVLKQIIAPHSVSTKTNPSGLFYNPIGPSKDLGDGIYIECAPTGYNGETTVEQEPTNDSRFDVKKKWDDFVQSDIFLFVFGIVLMAIVMKLGSFVLYKMFPNQEGGDHGGGGRFWR